MWQSPFCLPSAFEHGVQTCPRTPPLMTPTPTLSFRLSLPVSLLVLAWDAEHTIVMLEAARQLPKHHFHCFSFASQVSWGAHELVEVARNLMREALKDPLNRKFILLSESGLPLYPPTTTYLQLMQEDKSRLDSCGMGVLPLLFHPERG